MQVNQYAGPAYMNQHDQIRAAVSKAHIRFHAGHDHHHHDHKHDKKKSNKSTAQPKLVPQKLKKEYEKAKADLAHQETDWNNLGIRSLFKESTTSFSDTWKGYKKHADECNACQFNFKSAVGLALASQIDIEKACAAGIIFGTVAHFTPLWTGEEAAAKAGFGIAGSTAAMNILVKGFKMKQNPYVEIPLTVASLYAANKMVTD